jgi:hypothetical protein
LEEEKEEDDDDDDDEEEEEGGRMTTSWMLGKLIIRLDREGNRFRTVSVVGLSY